MGDKGLLDNSRMPSATVCVVFLFGGICETASCPVRDLSSPRVDWCAICLVRELTSPRDVLSASWQSASWRIRELSSYQTAHGELRLKVEQLYYNFADSHDLTHRPVVGINSGVTN